MSTALSLYKYLTVNKQVTARAARTMFKVENVADLVYRLRNAGVSIYTNRGVLSNGNKTFMYRLGEPSQAFLGHMKSRHIARARQSLYRDAIAVNG